MVACFKPGLCGAWIDRGASLRSWFDHLLTTLSNTEGAGNGPDRRSRSIRSKCSSRSKHFEPFEQLEHFELCYSAHSAIYSVSRLFLGTRKIRASFGS
jgi:hypothetical protein